MSQDDVSYPNWLVSRAAQPVAPASTSPASYVDRAALVAALAPIAMPCFSSRDAWITYLQSAAEEQRDKHAAGPLLFRKGEPVIFNRRFFPCADCAAQHAHAMWLEGRCKPSYLMSLPLEPAEEGTDVAT